MDVDSLDFKILPVAAVFGGNGSGKSNFYYALEFVKDSILKPKISEDDAINVEPFRLDEKLEKGPSSFEIKVLIGKEVFKYSFNASRTRVLEESLEILKGDKLATVYSRCFKQEKTDWNLDFFEKLKLAKEESEFIKFKARDTLPNQLFLNAVRGRDIPVIDAFIAWFKDTLTLIDPATSFKLTEFSNKGRDKLRHYCATALNRAHTGIDKIVGEEIPFEAAEIPMTLKTMLKEKVKEKHVFEVASPGKKRYSVFLEDGQLKCFQLVTYHRSSSGSEVRFDVSEESEGTQRLIDLLPAFHDLLSSESQKVYVIDELDRSLHTLLTRNLLESYLGSRNNESRGQLIFTTHDGLLMDQALFRRDEFWFIDKAEDGASLLSSLSDFKDVRYDKDIRKSYLIGRFGGIPLLRSFPRPLKETAN